MVPDIHRKQSEYPCEYNGLLTFTGILEIVEMAHFLTCPAENVRVNLGERGAAGELFNVSSCFSLFDDSESSPVS